MRRRISPSDFIVVLLAIFLLLVFTAAHAQRTTRQDTAQPVAQQRNSLFGAARTAWDKRQWEKAVAGYKSFVDQNPFHPLAAEAHSKIGEYLSYVASPEEAIAEYEKAIAKAPGTHAAHESKTGIAALKFFLQEYEEAHKLFREVLQETNDWSLIKECVYQLKHIGRLIELRKLPNERAGMDCGADALQLALKRRGSKIADKEMNKLLAMTGGVTLEQLREAAQATGLKAWGVKLSVNQLNAVAKPFIAHVGNNHYVVVTGFKDGKVIYNDPHQGETYRTAEKFWKVWRGSALVFAKDVPATMRTQLLTKAEMETIRGGHHLHGANLGGSSNNGASAYYDDPSNCRSGPGLPSLSVNLSNFNLVVQDTDFIYSGRGPAVGLTRTYNADSSATSAFGRSWTHNYNVFLVVNQGNMNVDVHREDGKIDTFDLRGDGTYNPIGWVYDRLTKNQDGTYKLELKRTKLTQNFDTQGRLTSIVDRNGNAVTLRYNPEGRLQSVTDAVGRMTLFEYYPTGNISKVTDPLGREATFTYDSNNDLVFNKDMAGNDISYTYNGVGYMTSVTTPQGTTTIVNGTSPYFGDLRRDLVVKDLIDAEGNTTHFDTGSTIAWVDDPRKNRTFYFNDTQGRTTQIEDALGNVTKFNFNGKGDLTLIKDANGRNTILKYNARGNVELITDPLTNKVKFEYDSRDNLEKTSHIAANSSIETNIYTYEYDEKDNLLEIKDPTNLSDPMRGITSFTYEPRHHGQPSTFTDARGKVTIFDYDGQGNLTLVRNPVGGETNYTYDNVGRLRTLTDPKRQLFSYRYDGNDRLLEITQSSGETTTYTYNCCNLSTITDASGTLTFDYDRANRLTSFTNTRNQVIRYGYDETRNLTTLTYPGDKVVRYEYDAANRLKKVTDWLNNTTIYSYDTAGNLISSVNSNGTMTGYQYDTANRLVSLINAKDNSSVISGYKYTLNEKGQRTNIAAIEPFPTIVASRNVSYLYDDDNRVTTTTGSTFTHDDNGNLSAVSGANPTTYSYDLSDRLRQVMSPDNNVQYQYDAIGNRITRTVNGGVTKYIVNPIAALSQVLAETDADGNITSYYIYGLGLISKVSSEGQTYFYHYNDLGSTIAITDSSGSIANKYAYDPFGNLSSNSTEGISNPFRYNGRLGVMDEGNGLLYMRARYYSPKLGRFINKDPVGLSEGGNSYVYSRNDPINFVDPTGLWSVTVCGGLGLGACITYGRDSGGSFLEFRGPFALGGGISYDPSGKFSGKPGSIFYAGGGAQCGISAGIKPISVSADLGAYYSVVQIYPSNKPELWGGFVPELWGGFVNVSGAAIGSGSGVSLSAVGGIYFGFRPAYLRR